MKRYESIARALIFAIKDTIQDSNVPSDSETKVRIYFIPNCKTARNLLELPEHESGVLSTEITTSTVNEVLNLTPAKTDERSAILSEHPNGKIMGFAYASHPNSPIFTDNNAKFEIIVELSSEEGETNAELSKLAGKAMRNTLPFMRNSGYSSFCPI